MTKISIVTGSNRGLGRNTAISIARGGGDLVLVDREDAGDVAAEIVGMGRKAVALKLDTGNIGGFSGFTADLKTVLAEVWQRDTFDHLVNNAGHGEFALAADTTEAQFDGLLNVHFKGVFFLTQHLLSLMADNGRIVNISSGLTRQTVPGYAAYAAMKGAVEVLTRYIAKEVGARGITVNTVAPGAIATDFGGGAIRDDVELNQYFAQITALGRVGLPDDIGPMIASLLREDNRWVTAQRIEVSGGQAL